MHSRNENASGPDEFLNCGLGARLYLAEPGQRHILTVHRRAPRCGGPGGNSPIGYPVAQRALVPHGLRALRDTALKHTDGELFRNFSDKKLA